MPPKPISSPTLSSPDAAAKNIKLLETLHVKLDSKPQCECNQLRQELMELKKMLGKSAEQPPQHLDTYSAVKMAINDAAAYSEKAKRAVWVGRPEESTPELTLASDQKAIEELCAELNDGSLSQALTDGKIRYHRHPEVKAHRKKRILKIVFTDEKTRDQFLSLIRSKRPSTVSRVPRNFVRRDLCSYELQLERKARIDAYALNCKIGGLAYGIRDEKLIKFNGIPRPLPAGYETRPPRGYSDLALLNLTNPAINTSLFLQSNGINMTLNESNSNPSSDILSTLTPMQSKPTVNTTAKGSGTLCIHNPLEKLKCKPNFIIIWHSMTVHFCVPIFSRYFQLLQPEFGQDLPNDTDCLVGIRIRTSKISVTKRAKLCDLSILERMDSNSSLHF
ncbi:hypothetical protein PRIPAC_97552 [Pristionchus pacificus]|uniref:Uncharacterized protein n=1 Tax=Pristionchus pacificus TaxID=54126 RepID=A0A2A6BCW8_PRIPA|nr:hypothetical protein PRIPAC_97552 [Pristionchus pacificus]|eukprot:PDM63719.1 hypothetical protein PRIPAC_49692 [Pristionchus pacificus]